MTEELLSLLRRVQVAGGPVRILPDGVMCIDIIVGRQLWHAPAPDDIDEWGDVDSAVLIHALRLDAAQRGLFVHAVGDYTAQGAGFTVWLEPHPERSRGDHETEACAWLLAWLDAFEEPE